MVGPVTATPRPIADPILDVSPRLLLRDGGAAVITGAPDGYDAHLLSLLVRFEGAPWLHVARDDSRAAALAEALAFFAPDLPVIRMPAWDCLPYDRVSPKAEIISQRMAALSALARLADQDQDAPLIVITTVNALLQRVPPRSALAGQAFSATVGNQIDLEALTAFLGRNGYTRASTVRDAGEFAVRGGILDLFPPGHEQPLRLDLFGDSLESVRPFDPESQRTTGQLRGIDLVPVSEVLLSDDAIQRFRRGYVAAFGAVTDDDPLYAAVSAGHKHQGMEHWLPLFYDTLETLFDYLPDAPISLDHLAEEARTTRLAFVADYFQARQEAEKMSGLGKGLSAPRYKALPPDRLYVTENQWQEGLETRTVRVLTPFAAPDTVRQVAASGRPGRTFAAERAQDGVNVFDALKDVVRARQGEGKRVVLACWTQGSADRMGGVLKDHGLEDVAPVARFDDVFTMPDKAVGLAVLGVEQGFETPGYILIGEQDVLGDRLIRQRKKTKKAQNFLTEAASLNPADLVVHVDHGIGRYEGLQTLEIQGQPHDCLLIIYHGGDKLFLPVENIELLSRYGSDDEAIQLDKLGGQAWQARKAKLKERIREMADALIKIAAERQLRDGSPIVPPQGVYDEFCARFPYQETEDQERAIGDALEDLGSGRPMDRLVCGDVGFGKTEVALRVAFVAAMQGHQVAVVVPTTLLARQHTKTFKERFAGWPIEIRQLSRMVSSKEASQTRKDLSEGKVDIVVGTHALLAKSISFANLGLLIIDEEQHFGVGHKERLKQLKANVHVLTLTATPIPRTLQLAMSGVRELSLIATPPVDRLAVRTYVTPFDPVVLREALLREKYRGGQSFFVCPRIADLGEAAEFLAEQVPEVKYIKAHGQMPAGELEDIMNAFYDGKFDVLLSTTIVESGLDIPSANTLVVHRADMFGLAQLYQIRGRIGRSKARAYAYLTVPNRKEITATAKKRLDVLQSLDTLGAGFTLASHDMDIRGAGNLLGEEQSGHVREVGIELYQSMLEEAVSSLRSGDMAIEASETWSPHINVGTAVLIPEHYVPDLNVRLSLYRRLADVETPEDIEGFAAELIDRFGPLPEEVDYLLQIVAIKRLCRTCQVDKVDAGPKGITLGFRPTGFPDIPGLIDFVSHSRVATKLKPDGKLVYSKGGDTPEARLNATTQLLTRLASLIEPGAGKKADSNAGTSKQGKVA